MVTDANIREKSDPELLEIWENQNDYVSEVVGWVKVEIERRQLDTRAVHVRTVDEVQQQAEVSGLFNLVRLLVFFQGALGLIFVSFAGTEIVKGLGAVSQGALDRPEFTTPLIFLAAGVLLIVYAVGVWRRKRWAFVTGMLVYGFISLLNCVFLLLALWACFGSDHSGQVTVTLALFSIATIISTSFTCGFNTLRKQAVKEELTRV